MTESARNDQILEATSVDADEVAFFAAISKEWWNPDGPFRPLHELNPTRVAFSRDAILSHFDRENAGRTPLEGLEVLDIGCGGGLLSEPLCRLGASMTGIDATEKNIKVASLHAGEMGLDINYRYITAEALADEGKKFDVIINMEVIEHVADVDAFLSTCRSLLKEDGIMLVSTLNRTVKSLLMAKIGAEYILRWLPIGAHDWNKFITPTEMEDYLIRAGFSPGEGTGFVYNPFTRRWKQSASDLDINYAVTATSK